MCGQWEAKIGQIGQNPLIFRFSFIICKQADSQNMAWSAIKLSVTYAHILNYMPKPTDTVILLH